MAEQASPWDDPHVAPKGDRYAKFREIGDTYEGVITRITTATFEAGKDDERTVPVLVLDTGQEITCGAANLHRQVYDLRPEVDDWISVRFAGVDEDNYNRKVFAIDVVRVGDDDPLADEDPWVASSSESQSA